MIWSLAFRNLFRNPRRTFAVLLTVALGTGSLFIFHGFNRGIMNQYAENTIHSRYGHGEINLKGYRDQVYEKPWEHWIENYSVLEKKLKEIPEVEYVFPRVGFFALLTNGQITVSGKGQGVYGPDESVFFNTLNIEKGATLSNQEDGIVLGKGLARSLDLSPGDRVTIMANTVHGSLNAVDLTVSGIFHTGSKDFDDVVFRIPLKQAQILLDTQKIESVAVGLKSSLDWKASWKNVAYTVEKEFPELEAISFAVLDQVYYQHSVDWLDSQFGVIQLIILVVVVLGIFNTVSTSILERRQEIGNLRANGESSFEVMMLLFCEGVALGGVGAAIGILGSIVINSTLLSQGIFMPPAPGLTRQFHVRIELETWKAVFTFGMGVMTAIIGTVFAGAKVTRMKIGDALRAV